MIFKKVFKKCGFHLLSQFSLIMLRNVSVFSCLNKTQNLKAHYVRFTVNDVGGSNLKQALPLRDGKRRVAVREQNFPQIESIKDSRPEGVRVYRHVGFESYIRCSN